MTAYIHIGVGKTGTSSIQACLAKAREDIADEGYLYPQAGLVGHQHWGFFDLGSRRLAEGALETFAAEMSDTSLSHVLLSSESFAYAPVALIGALRNVLPFDTRIIVYVRDQLALVTSTFLQWVKAGDDYRGSLEMFFARSPSAFDFVQIVAPWADAFGDDSIIAHVYDPEVVGKDVVNHFLSILQIRYRPAPLARHNPSLLPEFVPLITRLDEVNVDREIRKAVVDELVQVSTHLAAASKAELAGSDLKQAIRERYADSNRVFAARFLPEQEWHLLGVGG